MCARVCGIRAHQSTTPQTHTHTNIRAHTHTHVHTQACLCSLETFIDSFKAKFHSDRPIVRNRMYFYCTIVLKHFTIVLEYLSYLLFSLLTNISIMLFWRFHFRWLYMKVDTFGTEEIASCSLMKKFTSCCSRWLKNFGTPQTIFQNYLRSKVTTDLMIDQMITELAGAWIVSLSFNWKNS